VSQISDSDLQAIVKQVVARTMGEASVDIKKSPCTGTAKKAIAIGSDHGGFDLKEILKKELTSAGHEVIDCGTYNKEACDYPDFALAVAKQVSDGLVCRGIVIDGAGIGSCMVAN
jgi:ribose 5-phosphate isomerase B